jgi:3-hydroxyisobutyrate dehydrogenase-like beta-hydroxyacid dehydrogenase
MVSGNPAKVADLMPVFRLWGKTIVIAGNRPGAAQTMKLTNNMLCAVAVCTENLSSGVVVVKSAKDGA